MFRVLLVYLTSKKNCFISAISATEFSDKSDFFEQPCGFYILVSGLVTPAISKVVIGVSEQPAASICMAEFVS